ncbi:MAG: hypothetical protein ACFCVC_00415 [Acidimicrobiia bacterium]
MGLPRTAIELAAVQGGCVRRSQLSGLGLTDRQIDHLVVRRHIEPAPGGCYRLFPARHWHDLLASALCASQGAVVSHQAAAVLHDFPRIRRPIPTITTHTRTTHDLPGVHVIRSHDVCPDHVEIVAGLRTTTIARTLFDLCAVLHPKHASAIAQDLVLERRIDHASLLATHDAIARRGKPGVKSFRRILDLTGNAGIPPTELERRGLDLLERAGIPTGEREYPIPWQSQRRFDLAWPAVRLAVEWDSRRWHGAMEQMTFDRRRDREATLNGWTLVRFTWDDVTIRPNEVASAVRALLDRSNRQR